MIRPDDLVVISFRFENYELLRPQGTGVARLKPSPRPGGTGPRIWMDFDTQAMAEDTFFEAGEGFDGGAGGTALSPVGTVEAQYSQPSRIVMDTSGEEIDFTLEALLALCDRARLVTGTTEDFTRFQNHPFFLPDPKTAIEVPAGLVLSPAPETSFIHASKPVTSTAPGLSAGGSPRLPRTELWHTRLLPGRSGPATARALFEHDPFSSSVGAFGANTSLSNADREALVARGRDGTSDPVLVDRMMLSALGAWLEVHGDWPDDDVSTSSVTSWHHRATMGRDQYVRLARAGYLFPFGHRAVLVTVTRRRFHPSNEGVFAAYLRQRMFVLIRNPDKTYEGHKALPFKAVRLKTLVTPNLRPPGEAPRPGEPDNDIAQAGKRAFWLRVGTSASDAHDFLFHLVGVDHKDRPVEFLSPIAFIDADVFLPPDKNPDESQAATIRAWTTSQSGFLAGSQSARRRRNLGGARVAFAVPAPAPDGQPSDPVLETDVIEVGAVLASGGTPVSPFLPHLIRATARVPTLVNLAGVDSPVTFRYHQLHVAGSHPLGVFAELVDENDQPATLPVSLSPQQAGGLVAPQLPISSLSLTMGPLAGTPADLANSQFNPTTFFGGDPQLLGGISLASILKAGTVGGATGIPTMVIDDGLDMVTSRLRWSNSNLADVGPFRGEGGSLTLDTVRASPRRGGEPSITVTGRLGNVSLSLPSAKDALVHVRFDEVSFRSENGKKLDVSVKLKPEKPVEFDGPLKFVEALAEIIPFDGFADPPALSVTPNGVEVGYGLAVPTIAIGAFTLQNLAFSAAFNLPLSAPGSATVILAVSERHNPFIVTYSALGGGGFLAVGLDLHGVHKLEAAIEFGGAVAINLGVASGGVSIMAGIYYGSGTTPSGYDLGGFVRCNGVLEVLGLISVSVQFYLELRYTNPSPATVSGTASLTVKVKVVFFSKKVTLTVQREFSKSGDPTFADAMPTVDHWRRYCHAFA